MSYYESTLLKENKIEFSDNIFLCKNILNHRENALNYFYTSPFYTSKSANALNEKIRIGKNIEDEIGYLFEVSYDNLDILKKTEPQDPVAAHIFYNTNAIFHISLTQIYKVQGNICKKVIQQFCILNGKIYSTRSFGDLLTNKINNIVRNMDQFFDAINEMTQFNITSNYYFESKQKAESVDSYKNYEINDIHISSKKDEKLPVKKSINDYDKKTKEENIEYTKNVYEPAIRIADEGLLHIMQNENFK